MLHSMTAHASRTGALDGHRWHWEMRSVNARGLDLRLRLPEGLDGVEASLRKALASALKRGNVTVTLRLERDEGAAELALDEAALDRVLAALKTVEARAMEQGVTLTPASAAEVLAHRGVVPQTSAEARSGDLASALSLDIGPLLKDFTAMRAAEGAALQKVIAGQLDRMTELVSDAAEAAAARKDDARRALREAFARVLSETTEADEQRLAQELALLAMKQDVTEEIDRLRAHLSAAWDILDERGAKGRKLDFLSQEFNREANTLCSKSQNAALTAIGLDLKTVIDQFREQVQNVE